MLSRLTTTVIGAVALVYGIAAALTPLPAGVLSCVFGIMLIAAANPSARPAIRRLRHRWRWFDALVRTVGKAGPKPVRDAMAATEPPQEPKTGDRP